jgi:hypothetical protein
MGLVRLAPLRAEFGVEESRAWRGHGKRMRTSISERLLRQMGHDVCWWNAAEPGGRLLDGHNTAGGMVNLRLALFSVDDLDDEAVGMLRRAYEANI